MSALQRTQTGRQVCRCLEEETECDQDLFRALIARCFRRECSCLCGGSEMNLPILFHTRTGRPTGCDRPCQSRTLLYSLDMLCHSEIYKIKTSQYIPSTFTCLCSLYVRLHYTHCLYRHQTTFSASKEISVYHFFAKIYFYYVLKYCKL